MQFEKKDLFYTKTMSFIEIYTLILQIIFDFYHIMGYDIMDHINIIFFKISFLFIWFISYICIIYYFVLIVPRFGIF